MTLRGASALEQAGAGDRVYGACVKVKVFYEIIEEAFFPILYGKRKRPTYDLSQFS
jgi:hypothetical protein